MSHSQAVETTDAQATATRKPWNPPTATVIDVPGVTYGLPSPLDEGPANSTSNF